MDKLAQHLKLTTYKFTVGPNTFYWQADVFLD